MILTKNRDIKIVTALECALTEIINASYCIKQWWTLTLLRLSSYNRRKRNMFFCIFVCCMRDSY